MVSQNGLTALLVALLVLVIVWLVYRLRRESIRHVAVKKLGLEGLSELLDSCCRESGLESVSNCVSDLLRDSFQCQVVLFLDKERGDLICTYLHGVDPSLKQSLRLPFTRGLGEELHRKAKLRSIPELRSHLSEPFSSRLAGTGAEVCLPIGWGGNLYGVYFLRSPLDLESPSNSLLLATLAQVLSSAYHVKWCEGRRADLTDQLSRLTDQGVAVNGFEDSVPLADLVKYRNSETIVPRIVGSIKADLGLDKLAFVFGGPGQSENPVVFGGGSSSSVSSLRAKDLDHLLGQLASDNLVTLEGLDLKYEPLEIWRDDLRAHGFSYVAPFSLSPGRPGVLAMGDGGDNEKVGDRLRTLRRQAVSLVANAESYERIEELSYTDNLTGLSNRRYMFKRLAEEISRARRYDRRLAVILFDLDQLKVVNDRHGHQAGDAVLKQLGQTLTGSIRSIDIVARYGGDEFCVVMPEADGAICSRFMERLRGSIAQMRIKTEGMSNDLGCTISLGGAVFPDQGKDPDSLIYAADMALLKAKESGRNRSVLFEAE
jgi:diguanylate cyclase (GGDEF)-like protein